MEEGKSHGFDSLVLSSLLGVLGVYHYWLLVY